MTTIEKVKLFVRAANPNELPTIIDLGRKMAVVEQNFDATISFNYEKALNHYKKELTNNMSTIVVATINNEIVGYCYAYLISTNLEQQKTCKLEAIFVEERYRQKGIANSLINWIIAWAKNKNASTIMTDIFAANINSTLAFEKHNFKPHITTYLLKLQS